MLNNVGILLNRDFWSYHSNHVNKSHTFLIEDKTKAKQKSPKTILHLPLDITAQSEIMHFIHNHAQIQNDLSDGVQL